MKKRESQLLLFVCILFFNNFLYSQEETSFFKDCLRIKGNETSKNITGNNAGLAVTLSKNSLNFNPMINFSKDGVLRLYKNLVTKNSSLFVVYRSTATDENNLLSLQKGDFKVELSTKKIICDKEILLNKGDSKTGACVSLIFSKNSLLSKKKGKLFFNEMLFNSDENKNQIAEILYFPRSLTSMEKNSIESYLSLKYGISLEQGKDYYNVKGDKIWDAKENKTYSNHVTGIGKANALEFFQKQSFNSELVGLTIGLNTIKSSNNANESEMKDNTFLIWADNNKSSILEKIENTSIKRMNRVWLMNTFSEEAKDYKTQIRIDKKQIPLENSYNPDDRDYMWIAIDSSQTKEFHYDQAKYIKATLNNENEIVFDHVSFNSATSYLFTIVKAPETVVNNFFKTNESSLIASEYNIFPNPVKAYDTFFIQFHLKEEAPVSIQIADENGKIIRQKELGILKNYTFQESLTVSGTYMILVSINGLVKVNKIIVK